MTEPAKICIYDADLSPDQNSLVKAIIATAIQLKLLLSSVVTDSETDIETADFSRVRPSPKPRFFAAVSDNFGASVR